MLVNQLAYIVIVRLATDANVLAAENGTTAGGLTSYTNAHLIFILPHSVITVSVVAALLPRMSRAAHAEDYPSLAADLSAGCARCPRSSCRAAVALIVLGGQAGILLFGSAPRTRTRPGSPARVAAVLALGLLPFTLYYIVLRGWYALERTRTAFWVTVVLNALYLGLAWPLFQWAVHTDHGTLALPALAVGYVGSYWITLVVGWVVLARRIGGLQTARTLRALVRMGVAGLGTLAVMSAGPVRGQRSPGRPGQGPGPRRHRARGGARAAHLRRPRPRHAGHGGHRGPRDAASAAARRALSDPRRTAPPGRLGARVV